MPFLRVPGGSAFPLVLAAALLAAPPGSAGEPSDRIETPQVKVRLLADRTAAPPGGTLRFAVVFEIAEGWHIYWASKGDPDAPGVPTTIALKPPEGFAVKGPLWPPPARREATPDGDLFILEGTAAVLFEAAVPKRIEEGGSFSFSAAVEWQSCSAETCINREGTLSLSLPAGKAGAEASAANGEVFDAAVAALPPPAAKARYVALSGRAPAAVRPGETFDAELAIRVREGHHIQSHDPGVEGLVPTDVYVEPAAGLSILRPVYPEGRETDLPGFGKVREYSGEAVVKIPATLAADAKDARAVIRGILRYQACTEAGQCFRPEDVSFEIAVPGRVEPSPAPPDSANPQSAIRNPPAETTDHGPQTTDSPNPQSAIRNPQSNARPPIPGAAALAGAAFLGGLLLNIMPCVLPVISIKVLSFVRQAGENPARAFALGLTFVAGIEASFLAMGLLIVAAGQAWGGVFQRPEATLLMAAVVTAMALSLFGVFTLNPPRPVNELAGRVSTEGHLGAFSTGFLATILGTACTAPFLSGAIAVAARPEVPAAAGIGLFAAAGAGMAFPYVLLTAWPPLLRFVPRPGPWLSTFEAVMGFFLLGTAVWLVSFLPGQITADGLVLSLVFLLAVGIAAWLYGRAGLDAPPRRRLRFKLAALAVAVWGWALPFQMISPLPDLKEAARRERVRRAAEQQAADWERDIPWRPYSRAAALAAVRAGWTVFVDFTADWCINCKVIERTAINIPSTRRLMRELGVVPFQADFTAQDPEIEGELRRFGRAGVPLYVLFRPGDVENPEVRVLLTAGELQGLLRKAGPSPALGFPGGPAPPPPPSGPRP